jgi:predicted acetyltransferase
VPADALLLSNLLELYIHELSAVFPEVTLGADGRFGYPKLELYFKEPESRFPFLIRSDGGLAGFALVTRGSPIDPHVFDVAEFFVIRALRGRGVGREAAFQVWKRMPGPWTVRVAQGNTEGLAFWQRTLDAFAPGRVAKRTLAGKPRAWQIFAFESGV